jgi:protein phosphatase
LGVDEVVALDVNEYLIEAGDLYLLCSDGLSDMVNDGAIAKILTSDTDLEPKTAQLIDAANANGGRDNISALLVELKDATEKRGLIARLLGR